MAIRSASEVIPALRTLEGGGFPVRRPFPTQQLSLVDPFLLLDEMGPVDWGPGEAVGAPDHPHRGFETITYLLEGHSQHKDSHGHVGNLGPGDVQWMTAGSGVVHSEMPSRAFQQTGGRSHGFQLWVNLPRDKKMMAPRYQDIRAEQSPVVFSAEGDVRVRIIAGEAFGKHAEVRTEIPLVYLHVTLEPKAEARLPLPADHNGFVYAFRDGVRVGAGGPSAKDASEGEIVLLASDGDTVSIEAGHLGADVLLLGAPALNEPVARYGPFVMNTMDEIRAAFADYQSGRFGKIAPSVE